MYSSVSFPRYIFGFSPCITKVSLKDSSDCLKASQWTSWLGENLKLDFSRLLRLDILYVCRNCHLRTSPYIGWRTPLGKNCNRLLPTAVKSVYGIIFNSVSETSNFLYIEASLRLMIDMFSSSLSARSKTSNVTILSSEEISHFIY